MQNQDIFNKIVNGLKNADEFILKGDLHSAYNLASELLKIAPQDLNVKAMLGSISIALGDFKDAIEKLQPILDQYPHDINLRIDLANAHLNLSDYERVFELCNNNYCDADNSKQLLRYRAFAYMQTEKYDDAIYYYKNIVKTLSQDAESWNNLGNCYASIGEYILSIDALQRAIKISPDSIPTHLNLATSFVGSNNADKALKTLENTKKRFPNDAIVLKEYAALAIANELYDTAIIDLMKASAISPNNASIHMMLAEAYIAIKNIPSAIEELLYAIELEPENMIAITQLAVTYDVSNRINELEELSLKPIINNKDNSVSKLVKAILCKRKKDFTTGLSLVSKLPEDFEPIRVQQLKGEFLQRLGHHEDALSSYSNANKLLLDDISNPAALAKNYFENIKNECSVVNSEWFAKWNKLSSKNAYSEPVFLVGFPRSGTTLLDTFLMGDPNVQVLEEKPTIRNTLSLLGKFDNLRTLSEIDLQALRTKYFDVVKENIEYNPSKLLIDKFPLYLNRVPIIKRLFPNAKFILAIRHPLDVVLSCYITPFAINSAMSNFLTLETTANLYDLSFSYWEKCVDIMSVDFIKVNYEQLTEKPKETISEVFNFIGLEEAQFQDHIKSAMNRGLVSTASYSQITEPIYKRAVNRWVNYKQFLEPVFPKMEKWVKKFGYDPI